MSEMCCWLPTRLLDRRNLAALVLTPLPYARSNISDAELSSITPTKFSPSGACSRDKDGHPSNSRPVSNPAKR